MADELLIHYNRRNDLDELIEKYPNKIFTIYLPTLDKEIDWVKLNQYKVLSHNNLNLCLENEDYIEIALEHDIPFFMGGIVRDFFTFNRYRAMGVSAMRVTAPITNYLPYLRQFSIEIRVFPNQSGIILKDNIEFDGVPGGWYRPEDLAIIEGIDVAEFMTEGQKREQALFRIYAKQKTWSGDLGLIIDNLGAEYGQAQNRMIPPEFQAARNECKQRCQYGGGCRLCYSYLRLANPELLKQGLENE